MKSVDAFMNRQLLASQNTLLERLLSDKPFAERLSRHPAHALLGVWLPRTQGSTVLELGCGPGKYVAMLHSLGFSVVGVDPIAFPSWDLLRREASVTLRDRVNAEALPFTDGSFDHAVCLGAVLYFEDLKRAMAELRRVVKPGGRVIIRTVNKHNLYTSRTGKPLDPASRHLFSMGELTGLLRDHGFTPLDQYSYGYWPPYWPRLWWYLVCVWLPLRVQHFLSARQAPERHINHCVLAVASPN
jgi:SAM-dependent methyltransferase